MERADNLAKRKEIYEKLFPQTKHGGDRKSENIKNQVTESVICHKNESFVESTAKLTGQSEKKDCEMITKCTPNDYEIHNAFFEMIRKCTGIVQELYRN